MKRCASSRDIAMSRLTPLVRSQEGVQSAYQVHQGQKTGACAVVITGHDR